ncbi:MAG: hypothetical protein HUU60_02685 [Armatimonadetes bacterium]|nr:hypothetical protein [Armatimonadota bacterium]
MPLLGLVAVFLTCSVANAQPNQDYAFRAYSHQGTTLALAKHKEGRAIVIDPSGSVGGNNVGFVYVTGRVYNLNQTRDDIGLVKLNGCAMCNLWDGVVTYDGPGNGDDVGNAIGLDGEGNIYVAGTSYGGQSTANDMVVLKYDADGDLIWSYRYDRDGKDDHAAAMIVTSSGVCYVVGYTTTGETSHKDMTAIKVNANGTLGWARHATFGTTPTLDDWANCVALSDTHLYVGGVHRPGGTAQDIGLMKIKLDGPDDIAYYVFDGNGSGIDVANAIAVTGANEVYLAGKSYYNSTRKEDYVAIKLNSSLQLSSTWPSGGGQPQGVRYYNGDQDGDDEILAMALDSGGNIVATGRAVETSGDPGDITTVRYTAGGDVVSGWPHKWDRSGSADRLEEARSIVVDSEKNVYVGGLSVVSSDGSVRDMVSFKLKPNGSLVGGASNIQIYDGPAEGNDYGNAIAVDNLQRAYLTGSIDMGETSSTDACGNDADEYGPQIGTVSFFTAPLFGDANEDDCVDDTDQAIVLEEWGQQGSGLAGDVNGDGIVDDTDLAIVLTNFGKGCCS